MVPDQPDSYESPMGLLSLDRFRVWVTGLMRTFLVYWLPLVLWMGLIFWMSTSSFSMKKTARFVEPILRLFFRRLSGERMDVAHMRIREAAHFGEYVVLSLLAFRAVRADNSEAWRWEWMAIALAITIAYAVTDELHQKWESGRTPKVKHVMIDVAGGVTAQLLLLLCLLVRPS